MKPLRWSLEYGLLEECGHQGFERMWSVKAVSLPTVLRSVQRRFQVLKRLQLFLESTRNENKNLSSYQYFRLTQIILEIKEILWWNQHRETFKTWSGCCWRRERPIKQQQSTNGWNLQEWACSLKNAADVTANLSLVSRVQIMWESNTVLHEKMLVCDCSHNRSHLVVFTSKAQVIW